MVPNDHIEQLKLNGGLVYIQRFNLYLAWTIDSKLEHCFNDQAMSYLKYLRAKVTWLRKRFCVHYLANLLTAYHVLLDVFIQSVLIVSILDLVSCVRCLVCMFAWLCWGCINEIPGLGFIVVKLVCNLNI